MEQMQVAPADGGTGDLDDDIAVLDDFGFRYINYMQCQLFFCNKKIRMR
jgi:hypothetical protein